jgi:N-acetylglucosamine-6-phosphate deacetylase
MLNKEAILKKCIDFHCHGIGDFDFTDIKNIDLNEIQSILEQKNHNAILTLYLLSQHFSDFLKLMDIFAQDKQQQKFTHIMGFALEGPLLSSHGGTPKDGVWQPTKQQWQALAACGKKGLIYMVLSPDVVWNNTNNKDYPGDIAWVAQVLLEGGVLPAPGHFKKDNPIESAKLLQRVFDVVAAWGHGPTITDHLFNDMPLNFKHAWRSSKDKLHRRIEIADLKLNTWDLHSIEEKMGIVPATIIKNAHKGYAKICLNFDGEHVDLTLVKKAVELIGVQNMIMMTDSVESKRLAGQSLHTRHGSTLLYQHEGIVAAGSQSVEQQIQNMLSIGLDIAQIEQITYLVPSTVLKKRSEYLRYMQ